MYIVVKERLSLLTSTANEDNKAEKGVAFKNNAPFKSCISKINNTLISNVKNLHVVMRMYNLIEYSYNYLMTSGRLWNCYSDKIHYVDANDNASDCKWFQYKTKIVGKTSEKPQQLGDPRDADWPEQTPLKANSEVTIPLKYCENIVY